MNGRQSLGRWLAGFCLAAALLSGWTATAVGQTVGMVVNHDAREVYIFDADTDTLLQTLPIPLPPGELGGLYDCVVTAAGRGFVSDYNGRRVWPINLTNPGAPILEAHIDVPIEVQDLDLSVDQQRLLAAGAGTPRPLIVLDAATGALVGQAAGGYQGVEACSNNTILATQYSPPSPYYPGAVMELTLRGDNSLPVQSGPQPLLTAINAACEPFAEAGVGVTNEVQEVYVLGLPGIVPGSYQGLASPGIAAVFSPRRNALFVRSENFVQRFPYDAVGQTLGAADMTYSLYSTKPCFGVDPLAIHPNGSKLYVPEDSVGLQVWDAIAGSYLGHIDMSDTTMQRPARMAGVCLPEMLRMTIDIEASVINPAEPGTVGVVIYGTVEHPASHIVSSSLSFGGNAGPIGKVNKGDYNGDGAADMRVYFARTAFGLQPGDRTACLTGYLKSGVTFAGCDALTMP